LRVCFILSLRVACYTRCVICCSRQR
jgi:hypothetical protein